MIIGTEEASGNDVVTNLSAVHPVQMSILISFTNRLAMIQ